MRPTQSRLGKGQSKPIWTPFEIEWRTHTQPLLPSQLLQNQKLLIAVSGGRDSIALLHLLWRLQNWHRAEIEVCHVHHGPTENQLQRRFRDEAQELVRKTCLKLDLPLHLLGSSQRVGAQSEAEMRQLRHQAYAAAMSQSGAKWLALGHHAEDLLETRILRLMRGTGPQGLRAMQEFGHRVWRPFLSFSQFEIQAYALQQQLAWREDPSNLDLRYQRNWLRHRFLAHLQERQPRAIQNFAMSLERISRALTGEESLPSEIWQGKGISHVFWQTLGVAQQKQALATYCWQLGLRDFRHTQIEEIWRRLDKGETGPTFTVAGLEWTVSEQVIVAQIPKPRVGSQIPQKKRVF